MGAEFRTEGARAAAAGQANDTYQEALAAAKSLLSPANPTRLGLALNNSVFYNEVMGNAAEAVALAHETVKEAEPDLPNLDQNALDNSSQIIQLLRDNLALWKTAATDGRAPELD